MYTPKQLLKGLRWSVTQSNLVLREFNRAYHKRLYRRTFNSAGVNVMAEDWDTLIILDACRYDMFIEQHHLPGTLSKRTSRGAHTSEFIFGNFHQHEFADTVYVTGSPILERGLGHRYRTKFQEIINVWAEDGWDEEHNTVLPETMTTAALAAAERYPNKRLIVHYIQPHYPFIGFDLLGGSTSVPDPAVGGVDIWEQLMTGKLSIPSDQVWNAYRKNLDAVLPHVEELMMGIDGKVVVTADHGNMIDEPARPFPVREWGHPPGIYTKELTTVPWLEYESGPRREIISEETATSQNDNGDIDAEVVNDRLRHLGYVS